MWKKYRSISLSCIAAALASLVLARSGEAQLEFPVPRAEAEFRQLMGFVRGFGEANKGDIELFRRWVLPFAPLDLQVGKASNAEAAALRNMYLGIAGAAFGVDAAKLTASFHCGPECTAGRRRELEEKLPKIDELVSRFRKLQGIDVVSVWGIHEQYRVNDFFKIGTQMNFTSPSPTMEFVPSGSWKPVADLETYLAPLKVPADAVHEIHSELAALSLAAIVREADGSIRVVRIGISDNESGLHFPVSGSETLKLGDKLPDGRDIEVLEEVRKGVVFYETT
jgi:hypothetical protein